MSSRTREILVAVDNLIRIHNEWEEDRTAPDVPTVGLENAIETCVEIVCNGDIPARCREINTAVSKLAVEWHGYRSGTKIQPNGRPHESLWAAFRGMVQARLGAVEPEPRSMESVKQLRGEKVPDQQIAKIYGVRRQGGFNQPIWEGPFFDASGRVDHAKIDKEATEPGSVIGADWIHPNERSRVEKERKEIESRLQRLDEDDRRRETTPYQDPASIEDMLREGAFPAQIANVKGCTIQEVWEVAEKIGLEPNDPNSDEVWNLEEVEELVDDKPEDSENSIEKGDMDELIIKIYSDDTENKLAAGEIAAQVSEKLGVEVKAQKVAAVLRELKKNLEVQSVE